jgi:hypothetical protein
VTGQSEGSFLQLHVDVTGQDATSVQLKFDMEVWDAAKRNVSLPGEAALDVIMEIDKGSGFTQLLDLGTVSTGEGLVPPAGDYLDGNADSNRLEFDSSQLDVDIPADSTLRIRWAPNLAAQSTGWVYGLDNVQLSVFGDVILGDFNRDGVLGVEDVDLVSHEIWDPSGDPMFDLTNDSNVSHADVDHLLGLTNRLNGDADFDGKVQFSDFLILSENYGQADSSWSAGDFNSDGLVGFPDFLILANKFGESAQIAASVPEPSGVVMIAIALAGTLRRRRERGQACRVSNSFS